MTTLIDRLHEWKTSPSKLLCLDLRPRDEYQKKRIVPSTNIPYDELRARGNELPPKQTPFAVIEPSSSPECSQWLVDNGWKCSWIFCEAEDALWETVLGDGYGTTESPSGIWPLFRPSPLLSNHIQDIEASIVGKLQCLDVGCGAGRDIVWLLARNNRWKVSAIDSLPACVEKTKAMGRAWNVSDRLTVTCAKVMANGRWQSRTDNTLQNDDMLMDRLERKKARLAPGIPVDSFFAILPDPRPPFDLILTIRFLARSMLRQLPGLLKVGGYLAISQFVDHPDYDYKQPSKEHRLSVNEISDLYMSIGCMEIIVDIIDEIEDGRPVNSVLLKRIK
ncbi:hypothetical protein J3Q64DRAFT_1728941 [Phycomyces blakesleeanus]|uniref:Rhodanese domain-containing protein n=2 Tax=Phycomyces blakesleeanus TaxID=4837 RepID=A0A167NNI3_PHYB8|nr:hypothetical protein PHYBLDRAFT_59886 [Phycomyces blakesleeanus NRRL 1555(-)]OAD76348.1 hypothetical protein PHYBLDRAFT_59886 [Phycomyces blakesleeanus NRRL 1555(-)]|eukprot:XP_018294388.1 hypothetical protein PHYBLDRAFT_59886 [Phycomyces blakesleeanus NRRL 1555(-)]